MCFGITHYIAKKVPQRIDNERLQRGDLIVLVSDGVMDGSRDGQMEWLEAMVRRYQAEPPQKLCERLVALAAARKTARKDDMTALAARIGAA